MERVVYVEKVVEKIIEILPYQDLKDNSAQILISENDMMLVSKG